MFEAWIAFFFVFLFGPMLLTRLIRTVFNWLGALI